jgi:hypothetical protein
MDGDRYTSVGGSGRGDRAHEYRVQQEVENSLRTASNWQKYVPRFRVPYLLSDFVKRPKNTKKGIAEAYRKMKEMHDQLPDAGSMLVVDEAGEPILAVFAERFKASPKWDHSMEAPLYPGSAGRTPADFAEAYAKDPHSVVRDALPVRSFDFSYYFLSHRFARVIPLNDITSWSRTCTLKSIPMLLHAIFGTLQIASSYTRWRRSISAMASILNRRTAIHLIVKATPTEDFE